MSKLAFITGASSGIGEACARTFAKHGINIIITARRKERLQALEKELKTYNINILPLQLDVRDRNAVFDTIDNLDKDFKNIDILINNAGLSRGLNKIHESNIKDWEEMIDTNIKGLLYVTKAILPRMIERNLGDIVNLSSIAAHEEYVGGNVYCATKSAVLKLSKSMRLDLIGKNIRIISIDPGMVYTEFSLVRLKGDKEKADSIYKGLTPLHANDIADIIYFAITRPRHVTLEDVIIMPTDQATVNLNVRNM